MFKCDIPCVDQGVTCPKGGRDWCLSVINLVLIKE